MRDWNFFISSYSSCVNVFGFYLTYEGLKPLKWAPISFKEEGGFYLTYEGLKLRSPSSFHPIEFAFLSYLWGIETQMLYLHLVILHGLYLTYEGSKHENFIILVIEIGSLYLTYEGSKRAGRKGKHFFDFSRFLSYLWGIETKLLV
mgnify:CR=1 FL=1